MSTNIISPSYPNYSPDPDLPHPQLNHGRGSSTFVNSNYTGNSNPNNHDYHYQHNNEYKQNPRYHHQFNPGRNRPSRQHISPATSSSSKVRSVRFTHAPIEMDISDESHSDLQVHSHTKERLTKKRKQSGNDAPMEIHDKSPHCQQARDYHLELNTTSSNMSSTKITDEALRFAQTRHPFPPFILQFKTNNINDKALIEELINYSKLNYDFDLELSGFRKSLNRFNNNNNYCNLLIFVKNSASFSFLYSDIKWPDSLGNESFTIDRQPSIPPQLAVIITNVSYNIDFNDFENDMKSRYGNVVNVIRLKNKNHYDTKIIKVEFNSGKTRDEILKNGYMLINYVKYDVKEYLSQATILICSKCWKLGHFRKQCKQDSETCKVCSENCSDLSKHVCSGVAKCLHCGENHHSNDMKCKIIKNFRAELTKNLVLSFSNRPSNNSRLIAASDFPPLPHAFKTNLNGINVTRGDKNEVMDKLDQILNSINSINGALGDLTRRTEKIEGWLIAKEKFDSKIQGQVESLQRGIVRHDGEILKHNSVIEKLIIPVLDDILMVMMEMNVNDGRVSNADFNSRSGVWKSELKAYCEKRLKFRYP